MTLDKKIKAISDLILNDYDAILEADDQLREVQKKAEKIKLDGKRTARTTWFNIKCSLEADRGRFFGEYLEKRSFEQQKSLTEVLLKEIEIFIDKMIYKLKY